VAAIGAALRDAGLEIRDVDGVVRFDRGATWEFDLPGYRALVHAARALYREARITPRAVDHAYLYDAPSPLALLGLEHFGLCARGKSADFVRTHGLGSQRRPPPFVNPHGGQLGEADLDGVNDLVAAAEAVRTGRARVALVAASPLEPTSAVLLGA